MFRLTLLGVLFLQVQGIWVPNCSKQKHKNKPQCKCRYSSQWETELCKTWFANNSVESLGKIVGGENAPVDAYPWFARLTNRNGGWAGCGGMLVAPEYVLTAAHCVSPNTSWSANQAAVQIGAVCPNSGNNCGQPLQQINVASITDHPNYNANTMNNDYALVKLASKANATPVPMDQGQYVNNYANTKRKLWAIGFGALSSGGNTASQLRHVELGFVPRNTCNSDYSGDITNNMMCAKDPGQDSCQGDSGGPLYDEENNALVGVVSWGYGCADPSYPGVYAQVSARWDWIKSTICGNHSNPKPSFCSSTPTPPTPTPPTPTPPTPTPPTGCGAGKLDVTVSVTPDTYPEEISWTIKTPDSTTVASNGSFTAGVTSNINVCLDSSICYTFEIKDSYGDGLPDSGDFTVTVDNIDVLTNPNAGYSSLMVSFGQCGTPPTPVPPTAAPIPVPPTAAPISTVPCNSGELDVAISVTTDKYPTETVWTLGSYKSESFTEQYVTYNKNFCLDPSICHSFEITDTYGDGIIVGDGDFSVTVNGNVKLSLGDGFTYTKSVKFGACEENIPCPQSWKKRFKLELTTDSWGDETSFKVMRRRNNGKFTKKVFARSNFESDTQYSVSKCLPKNKCYKLIVYDSVGDGMEGSFQGYWKGVEVPNEDTEFASGTTSKSEQFGKC